VKVLVLNGVNLDVLDRRDETMYGGLSLSELETRIYAWARELGATARCRQTNTEGQYVEWCHEALEWADAVIANPGAWTHYSYAIHDALDLSVDRVDAFLPANAQERSGHQAKTQRWDQAQSQCASNDSDDPRKLLDIAADDQD